MFEANYSLFQLLGISFFACLMGVGIGGEIGKAIQRKRDIWMFGPRFMRTAKPPRWARRKKNSE